VWSLALSFHAEQGPQRAVPSLESNFDIGGDLVF
jgi:hypothetical protein